MFTEARERAHRRGATTVVQSKRILEGMAGGRPATAERLEDFDQGDGAECSNESQTSDA